MPEEHRPTRLIWVLGLLLLIGSTAGTAWYLGPWSSNLTPPPDPSQPAPLDVVAQGHVDVPSGVVALFPALPGRVSKIFVKEGQSVSRAGEPLLALDDRLAGMKKDEAEAAWKAATAQEKLAEKLKDQHAIKVKQQKVAIRIAEQTERGAEAEHRRQKKLYESKAIPEEALIVAETLVEKSRAMIDAEKARLEELEAHVGDADLLLHRAKQEVALAQARLKQAELAVDECVIKSPAPGKVLRLQANVGDMLTAQPIQPAITFAASEPLIIRAEVDQEDTGRVKVDDIAEVMDDTGMEMRRWEGKVIYVSDWLARRRSVLLEPGQLNDVRTLECIIKLNSNATGLRIGQRVRVHIRPNVSAKPD